jgi:hypothetical protein
MSGWNRRQLAMYWIFVAAAASGVAILNLAVERGDRPIVGAIVAAAVTFAAAWGLVLVIRVLRGR